MSNQDQPIYAAGHTEGCGFVLGGGIDFLLSLERARGGGEGRGGKESSRVGMDVDYPRRERCDTVTSGAAGPAPGPGAYVRLPALGLISAWMIEDALLGACMDVLRVGDDLTVFYTFAMNGNFGDYVRSLLVCMVSFISLFLLIDSSSVAFRLVVYLVPMPCYVVICSNIVCSRDPASLNLNSRMLVASRQLRDGYALRICGRRR
ncbi:hypothetical protein CVT26_007690 [Gymnopilus dilepis]|uniref:Uncharacterized protein n=1 Tax=Gymnopilus dilepis TaxID=231916 RepID=A0A409WSB3_9AGAR|nr:hypothetical protein CVT26_007690 [Gymnopilus dilepis]